ncbi:MAG: hypothetical protein Q7S66_04895 [bacterium]|nr:hypothetical protein [bacterium]
MLINLGIIGQLLIIAILIPLAYAGLSMAPWVPSRKRDLERIFKLANGRPGEVFYDLGSGNGQLIFHADKLGYRAVGLEISWPLFLYSKIKQTIIGAKNTKIKLRNLFKENLGDADVVFIFGMPRVARQLQDKLLKELKPGARVISYAFSFPDWQPETVSKPDKKELTIFLYKKSL